MTTRSSSHPGPDRPVPVPASARRAASGGPRTDGAAPPPASEAAIQRRIAAAVAAERERIAHDLHDSVGGRLTAAHLLSSDLAQRLPSADAALAARVAANTAGAMEQIRAACHDLAAPCDVAAALTAIAAEADGVRGVRCTARIAAEAPLPQGPDGQELLLLVREAVANALRHAQARTVTLSVDRARDGVVVQVVDDGVGFSPGPITGLGLTTMQRRARRLGASLSIESAPRAGTTVRVALPPEPAEASPSPPPPSHA